MLKYNTEYDDDLTRIPQSSLVHVRRLPAKIPGKGTAYRYVSGKAPVNARTLPNNAPSRSNAKVIDVNSAKTEEERMAAIMQMGEQQWQQKQQEMANETRVPIMGGKGFQKKPANVPEGDPPHGYICYRCGKKGHWIQACPTNDDPNFEGRVRIKRTTGIPRSMLKTIDQSEIDQLDEAEKQNLMVDADGNRVLAKTDEKEWAKHLEKVKASAAAQEKAGSGDKDLESRGLQCPIDKRMFVDPMKTPCCGKTYCNDCITNALIDSDLTCPGCETENIILEELVPDSEMNEKIKAYEAEQAIVKKSASPAPSANDTKNDNAANAPSPPGSKSPASSAGSGAVKSKKRRADGADNGKLKPEEAPAMKRQKSGDQANSTAAVSSAVPNTPLNAFMPPDMSTMMQNMPNMNFPMSMSMSNMPFNPMMGMMNPMMQNFMPNGFTPVAGMNGFQQQYGMYPNNQNNNNNNFQNPMMNSGGGGGGNQYQNNKPQTSNLPNGVPTAPKSMRYPSGPANTAGKFSNQQRPAGKDEDNAYMRQPVNPHRHQNRNKRVRPSDYREL